jgi:hypothetical protein
VASFKRIFNSIANGEFGNVDHYAVEIKEPITDPFLRIVEKRVIAIQDALDQERMNNNIPVQDNFNFIKFESVEVCLKHKLHYELSIEEERAELIRNDDEDYVNPFRGYDMN